MKTMPLKLIAEIFTGYQSRSRIEHDPDGTHGMITGSDFLSDHTLHLDGLLTFSPKRMPSPIEIQPEDILFQARGVYHFAHCVSKPPPKTLVSSAFYIVRPKRSMVNPHYLAWWINQPTAQRYLQAESKRTTMPFVSKSLLSRLQVRIPELRVQEAIHRVAELAQKERLLHHQIAERRHRLATALCMDHIRKQGA